MIRSINCKFSYKNNHLQLDSIVACSSLSYPSSSLEMRDKITGTWVELLDENRKLLYRLDTYAILHAVSQDDLLLQDSFTVLLPYLKNAKTIRVFAPIANGNCNLDIFGAPSSMLGEFPLSEPKCVQSKNYTLPCDIVGSGRGEVISVSQIVNANTVDNCYNLILLAERYEEDEQNSFKNTAYECVNYLLSRPPFTDAIGNSSLNVWLVEVASYPEYDGYFSTEYSKSNTTIAWSQNDVQTVCDTLFTKDNQPYWNWAGLVINQGSYRIGTKRGSQFAFGRYYCCLTGDCAWKVMQHEFGHAAFSLGDEYTKDDDEYAVYTGSEPNIVNATISTTLDDLKWKSLVTSGIAIPTSDDYGEDHKNEVGLYEGCWLYRSGIYRGQWQCVMKDQSDSGVDGYFCPVCLDEAKRIIYRTVNTLIDVPCVAYYSNSMQTWNSTTTIAQVIERYSSLKNSSYFDDFVEGLSQGIINDAIKNVCRIMASTSISDDSVIIPTVEADVESRAVWYLYSKDMQCTYYISAYLANEISEINMCLIKLPSFFGADTFDGVTVGLQQHLFSADGENLSYAILQPNGELSPEFTVQSVENLENKLSALSVTSDTSQIWVAVIDNGKIKVGDYSKISCTWLNGKFYTLDISETYHAVKTVKAGNILYTLLLGGDGLYLQKFNCQQMEWETPSTTVIDDTQDVLQADCTFYKNNLWIVCHTVDGIKTIQYNEPTSDFACVVNTDTSNDVITSLGCTVQGEFLHIIYIADCIPYHKTCQFKYDYTTGAYTIVDISCEEIKVLSEKDVTLSDLSIQNDGQRIYLVASAKTDVDI